MMIMINPIFVKNDRYSLNQIARNKEQVIGATMIVEQWTHTQRCQLIEKLVSFCNPVQLDMLWTVLQPALHRDYFYTVKCRYPNYHFKRISTPDSRMVKEYYEQCWDREESFYLSAMNDLEEFRDDDGLTRKSQSSYAQYSEDKSSSTSIQCPPIVKPPVQERTRSLNRSLDATVMDSIRKQKLSSEFTPKTARSVAVRWTNDRSIGSFSTASTPVRPEQVLRWFTHAWSESEQNDFLRRLIVKLDERQQYFISCVITQRRYRDLISLLPRKIAFQILNHLNLQELSRARQVCKNWKAFIDRESDLWKPKTKAKLSTENPTMQVDWEKVQKQRLATKRNWMTGTAHLIKCAGHTERVLCICGNQTHLATGSLDRTIKIWLLKDGKLSQTLTGHTKGVWAVKFLNATLLISGAYDATIKVWNTTTGLCLRTLLSHKGPIWSLACSNVFCLSGSQDRTARLWLLPKCELHATLIGHTSSVFGVDLNQEQNLCATASADKTVRLWSLSTAQCVKVLYGTTEDYIMSVSLQHGYIAYAFGVYITVYRININESRPITVQKIMETHEHRSRIESVQFILLSNEEKQPALISAGQDGLVKYWDLNNIASQHTYNTQVNNLVKINCIYVDANHIVTVGDDCLVKILDFTPRDYINPRLQDEMCTATSYLLQSDIYRTNVAREV